MSEVGPSDAAITGLLDALPHPAALMDHTGVPIFINRSERLYLGTSEVAALSTAPAPSNGRKTKVSTASS